MAAAAPSIEKAVRGVTSAPVLDFLKRPKNLLIGGKWVPAKSGKTFETINPANEEVLALVAEGDKADVDAAVDCARKAFEQGKWPSFKPHQRALPVEDRRADGTARRRAGNPRNAEQRDGDFVGSRNGGRGD